MSTGDSLSVIESCLDLPGALKLYFVHGGFSDGIYEQGKVKRGMRNLPKTQEFLI